jgi:threonylcarbamoyladenosine tRNA methylthiotransferase MtaB
MTSFFLQNFGCRVNQAEAFEWAEEFQGRGFHPASGASSSDVVVVNTCTLTSRADRDVRKFLARVRRDNPGARVIVTGCLVDRARHELESLPNITLIANGEKAGLMDLVTGTGSHAAPETTARFRARALLKVQDGCDCRCSFCIIPSVRGRSRSLAPDAVLQRLERLAVQGFQEVVLTGIHLSSYGDDLVPRTSLLSLLRDLAARDVRPRLRLSSLDPRSLSGELREFLAGSRLIRPHFHLSLQNGSDAVLARMGRKSRVAEYREILNDLRRSSPDSGLGADIIAGFPGESADDFRSTLEFLQSLPLSYFHVFSYSPRPGTAAAAWPQVPQAESRRRTTLLRRLSFQKSLDFRRAFLGRTLDAVVIRRTADRTDLLTANYIPVQAPPGTRAEGEAVSVTIERVEERCARGRVSD